MLEETCLHRVYTSLLVNMDCPSNSVMQTEALGASCSASLFRRQSLGKKNGKSRYILSAEKKMM